jgi:glycosyltransferase involved in cell wall biosynthesis
MNGLRVTHVSTTDTRGGAAKCAQRLHSALPAAGVRSEMLVALRFAREPGVREYNPLAPAPRAVGRAFFRLARRLHRPSARRAGAYFTFDRTLTGWRLLGQLRDCDVVNLHWVSDLLHYGTLPRLTESVPVVWTFHDMNAFTGGCHYSGSCRRFESSCGCCPLLQLAPGPDDATHRTFERKRRVLLRVDPARLTVVCPSLWLAREAERSPLFRDFPLRVIPSGIDSEEYQPVAREEARRRFGLPAAARIALFVAESVDDRRKGFRQLLQAVAELRDIPGLLLVTIGGGDVAALGDPAFRHLGPLNGAAALRAAYSAADVFAIPSLQDNFPNTVLEAMACATPVVGFQAGGIGEAVIDGRTGLLAQAAEGLALAPLLRRVLEDAALRAALAGEARAQVERAYTIGLQARRYADLYAEMAAAGRRSRAGEPGLS